MRYIKLPFKKHYVLNEDYELISTLEVSGHDECVTPAELGITEAEARSYARAFIRRKIKENNVLHSEFFKNDIKEAVIDCKPIIVDFDCLYEIADCYRVYTGWLNDNIDSLLYVKLKFDIDTLIDCICEDSVAYITEHLLCAYKPKQEEREKFKEEFDRDDLLYELIDNLEWYTLREILWNDINVDHLIDEIDAMLDYKVSNLC